MLLSPVTGHVVKYVHAPFCCTPPCYCLKIRICALLVGQILPTDREDCQSFSHMYDDQTGDAVLVGRPPWAAAAGVGSCPGLAAGRSSSPGSGEPGTLGTHHHPGPADQTLNLPEPANCRIKTNTQDGCQNFRFNALPMWEPWAGLGRWATFGWQLQCWTAAPLSGWRPSPPAAVPRLAASGAGPL